MTAELKVDSQRRLARIAGQVAGIQRMIDKDRACGDIMQQIVAVRAALDHLGVTFLSEHLQTCVLHQGVTDEEGCCADLPAERRTEEIRDTLKRFLK
ncbi:MAG TPA: metal-sensitive transcriptional regulator [Fimbriimonadaceae bacterium]|nr:metal-sensitive transcriptional regulator [Fimbriimonadaceae bacterium]